MAYLYRRIKDFGKKILKALIFTVLIIWSIFCALMIGGSLQVRNEMPVAVWVFIVIIAAIPYVIYFAVRNTYKKRARMRQDETVIYWTPTDLNIVSNEQVPSLIQNGLANAMRAEAQSANPALHRTYEEDELEFQFIQTYGSIMNTYEHAFEEAYQKSDLAVDDAVVMVELRNTITLFNKARNWAYSKGKGGKIYFQDMWEYQHNSKNDCFSYIDSVVGELSELETVEVVHAPNTMSVINQPLTINFKLDRYFSKRTHTDIKHILSDSLNIIKRTSNLFTFIGRFNLMLEKSERLGKHSAKFTNDLISLYPALLSNCVDRALFDVSKLKTDKGRKNKISKLIDILKESMIYVQACGVAETEQVNRLTTLLN